MPAKYCLKQKLLCRSSHNDPVAWNNPNSVSQPIHAHPFFFFFIREVNILGTADLWEIIWVFRYLDGRTKEGQQLPLDLFSFKSYLGVLDWELYQPKRGKWNQNIHQYQTTVLNYTQNISIKVYIKTSWQ